jgi:hypothetical protein
VRVNPDDQLVVDKVPIGGRVGPSIRFFVPSFSDGRLKRGRRVLESGAQDRRRAPLFLFRSLSCAAVNDDVLNRNCMLVGNFLSYIYDVMSSQGRISALPPFLTRL